ncbi:hypothetical protein GQ457_05G023880 [Hibiscus cannabinus]
MKSSEEKLGATMDYSLARIFVDFIQGSELIDLPLIGIFYTWLRVGENISARVGTVLREIKGVTKDWKNELKSKEKENIAAIEEKIEDLENVAVIMRGNSVDWIEI